MAIDSNTFIFYSEPLIYTEVKSNGTTKHIVSGYITTGDRDLVGDVVTQKCMDSMMEQLKSRSIKLDIEHESWQGTDKVSLEKAKTINPIGKINKAFKDSNGIFIEGELNPFHRRFDEVKGSIDGKFIDAYSIAYIPTSTTSSMINDKPTRLLDDITLLNVAVTGNAINTNARMGAVMAKSLEFMKSRSSNDDIKKEETMAETKEAKSKAIEPTPEVKAEDKDKVIADLKAKLAKFEQKDDPEKTTEPKMVKQPEPSVIEAGRIDKVEADIAQIKALLNKPQYKATQQSMDGELNIKSAGKELTPLDLIR